MKIFSICVLRDEVDVIAETLRAAAEWSDRILVLDNGSTDGTWELVQELAKDSPSITVAGRDTQPFRDELRGEVFEQYRGLAEPGDWWCRLDADEFYIDDPRTFLSQVHRRYGLVRCAVYNVYFTDVDLAAYEQSPAEWLARPVQERLRYYENNSSEAKFVRHRNDLRWEGQIWPTNRGRVCRDRIRMLHYQYRSPAQIARRLEIRQQLATLDPDRLFPHEAAPNLLVPKEALADWAQVQLRERAPGIAVWTDRIRPAADCDFDSGDGAYVAHPELMPPLPSPLHDNLRVAGQTRLGRRVGPPMVRLWRRLRGGKAEIRYHRW